MTKANRHIFLSYAAEDSERVACLANLLQAEGWPVWWDRNSLPPGQRFHRVIDEAIQNAFCVLVCWSGMSIDSDWVIDEAEEAKRQKKLLPVLFEEVRPPFGFRGYHYVDLSRWNGRGDQVDFERLTGAIAKMHPPDRESVDEQESTKVSGVRRTKAKERIYPKAVQELIDRLDAIPTEPKERLAIGDELAKLGDPRPGVGLDERGLPDIDWVEIAAGSFLYGEEKETRELPFFNIARYPITNTQFQVFINDGGYQEPRWWAGLAKRIDSPNAPRWNEPNRPRETVSWYEAVAFCRWLSHITGDEIRLPSETQWERAARGADGRNYPWGGEYRSGYANVDETVIDVGSYYLGKTTAVGVYRPQHHDAVMVR